MKRAIAILVGTAALAFYTGGCGATTSPTSTPTALPATDPPGSGRRSGDPSRSRSGALADDTFRRRYAERIGADESSLRDHAVLDPAGTVATDVERLRSAPAVSSRVTISGHVYRRGHRPGRDVLPVSRTPARAA